MYLSINPIYTTHKFHYQQTKYYELSVNEYVQAYKGEFVKWVAVIFGLVVCVVHLHKN